MPVSINERPNPNAVRTKWGWSHKDTGEQLVSAYAYFDGSYEADGGNRPNQGKPLVTGPVAPVSGKPKIDVQPQDSYFSSIIGGLSFTVQASFVDPSETDVMTYQWQQKLEAESTYKNLTEDVFGGVNTDTITTTAVPGFELINARYRCIVSVGKNSVTSTPAKITAEITAL